MILKRGINMNQEEIGKFISKLRKENNMTQHVLAEKLNVTDRTISNWETGRRLPDISILKELSVIFSVTIDEIIYGKKIEKEEIQKKLVDSAIEIYTTKQKIEKLQILTEILICAGMLITITLTSIIADNLSERIITMCLGSFVWMFGISLRIHLKKIHNPYE
jgi:transcriptional regulator with XRE-family HTH domain